MIANKYANVKLAYFVYNWKTLVLPIRKLHKAMDMMDNSNFGENNFFLVACDFAPTKFCMSICKDVLLTEPCYWRQQWVFVMTNWICHVLCKFLPGYTCRTTIIFGRILDCSLSINTLTSNDCLSQKCLPK